MEKTKLSTLVLLTAVSVLAVLAVVTIYTIAMREPITSTVPQVAPQAVSGAPPLTFRVNPPELISSPTPDFAIKTMSDLTPTEEPHLTPSLLGCYEECDSDDNCESDWRCQSVSGIKRCVNLSCPGEKNCRCLLAEISPLAGGLTPTPTGPTPTLVALPEAGVSLPTIGAVLGGVILTLIALVLAL